MTASASQCGLIANQWPLLRLPNQSHQRPSLIDRLND